MSRTPCKENCPRCLSDERIVVKTESLVPSILSEDDCCDDFHCRKDELNKFIHEEAIPFQKERLGTTYLFMNDKKTVGFVTLLMANIRRESLDGDNKPEVGKGQFPALQIGQLAVDVKYEDNDIGTYLLDWSVGFALTTSDRIGCRFVVLDAERQVLDFYEKYGFRMIKRQDTRVRPTLYIDIISALQ